MKNQIEIQKYFHSIVHDKHGLWTPNEGINLKNWADVVDKICFGLT